MMVVNCRGGVAGNVDCLIMIRTTGFDDYYDYEDGDEADVCYDKDESVII
jgi:hypothetical protein